MSGNGGMDMLLVPTIPWLRHHADSSSYVALNYSVRAATAQQTQDGTETPTSTLQENTSSTDAPTPGSSALTADFSSATAQGTVIQAATSGAIAWVFWNSVGVGCSTLAGALSLRFFENRVQHGPVADPVVHAVQVLNNGDSVRLLPNAEAPIGS
jgi:hypothetical protein